MENLAPPLLEAVRELKWRVSSGRSMREAVKIYLEEHSSEFSRHLGEWWARINQKLPHKPTPQFQTPLRQSFLHLIERGCAGQPTLEHLQALELEIELAADLELQSHVAQLPIKVLLPLLFFQFPAYLLLLIGPLLRELGRHLGG